MAEARALVPLPLAYGHPRGQVKAFCDGTVCLHVGDVHDHEKVRSTAMRSDCVRAFQRKLRHANAPPYNLCGSLVSVPEVVIMKLDAPFSEKQDARALFDVQHLGRVMAHLWGAIQLTDGNFYAYCLDLGVYLHEFILAASDSKLIAFRQPNTLNCKRSNMHALESATLSVARQPVIGWIKSHGKEGSRWVVRWQQGGNSKSFTRKLELKHEVEEMHRYLSDVREKQALLAQLWETNHTLAPRAEQRRTDFFSRNTIAPDEEIDGVHLGPWLLGKVEQHCTKTWCLRWSENPKDFAHFDSEEEARAEMVKANRRHPWQGNPWAVDEATGHRVIYLSEETAIFLPMNNPVVIEAIARHRWKPEFTETGYRALNADEQFHTDGNPWKYASTVIQGALSGFLEFSFSQRLCVTSTDVLQLSNDFTDAAFDVVFLKEDKGKRKRKRKQETDCVKAEAQEA